MNMNANSAIAPFGSRGFNIKRGGGLGVPTVLGLIAILRHSLPALGKSAEVNKYRARNFHNVWRGFWRIAVAKWLGIGHAYGIVWGQVTRGGVTTDLGIISARVVTTAGVNKLVSFLNASDTTTGQNFKYHGFGTGTTAEASTDTALVTEETTQYATDNVRPTGSQTTGGSSNVYRTVGTYTPDSGSVRAITEHGIFSVATVGSGTLLDRSKFSPLNLDSANGDSLQVTYDLTLPAGG